MTSSIPNPLLGGPASTRRGVIRIVVGCLLLLSIGFAVDLPVARWISRHALINKHSRIVAMVKMPGNFYFTLAVAAALILVHPRGREAAVVLIGAAILGGLFYSIVKWAAGRSRPIKVLTPFAWHPFENGVHGLWESNGLGFPSGHATLAFATAAALSCFLLPRWRPALFAAASVVALERILENAHYVSDVIAGAGFGFLAAWCALMATRRVFAPKENACQNR